MLRNATFLKGFSISGGFEYPEKLGNALAHKVSFNFPDIS